MIKTLKDRISLIYLYLVVMIAIIGTISVFNLFRLSNSINGLMTANYKSIKVINSMIENVEKQDRAIIIYIKVDNKKGIDSFMEEQKLFLQSYNIASNNITEHGEWNLVDQLNKYYMEYLKAFAEVQEIKHKNGVDEAFSFYNSTIQPRFEKIKYFLKELSSMNEKAMFRSKDQATTNSRQSIYVTLVISLIAVFGGFAAARYFVNRLLKPVDLLKETVKLIKAGDLNQQAPIVYPDEIGELATEFNNMTKRLLLYERSTIGKLMAEKNKSLAIVKSISDPLIVLDENYRIVLLNEVGEEFFEVEEEKVLQKHFLEIIRNGELFEYISGVFTTTDDFKQKIIALSLKEKEFYFNVNVKIVKNADATVNCVVILFQNITQIKQLEKLKTDFIATVSHEFKTPLTSILMGVSLLQDEKIGGLNSKQGEMLNTIKEDSETLSNLVNDLLEISKIESGRSIFKIQPCSMNGLVETAVKKFLEQAAANEVNLCSDITEGLPKVHADAEKILWVLNNLISNALKYTNAGDEILISAFVKHEKMCVTVKDTGIGIPPEYQAKLFDKFVQVKGYDLEVRGTGLGLAIAKEIVEAHGGEIWCESKLDVGSVFTFTLPLFRG